MAPEYGATMGFFPVDEKTLDYLRLTGREAKQIDLVERYTKANGLWCEASSEPQFTQTIDLDLGSITPSIAGPRRPQDRIELKQSRSSFRSVLMDDFGQNLDGQIPRLDRWGERRADPRGRGGRGQRRRRGGRGDQPPGVGQRPPQAAAAPGGGQGDAHEPAPGLVGQAAQRGGREGRRGRRRRQARAARQAALDAPARRRRDRRHHELHEHEQPQRDGRRRPCGQKGQRPWA